MKSKLEIYALSVCFASVVCLVVSLGIGSYALISMSFPSVTMNSYQYERHLTNESYWEFNSRRPCSGEDCKEIEIPEENVITERREKAFEIAQRNESRNGFKTLIKSVLFILFSVIAFLSTGE